MKLSEAIRLGAMLKPHSSAGPSYDGTKSCALQAAGDALRLRPPYDYRTPYCELEDLYPFLSKRVRHPVLGGVGAVESIIFNLNDSLKWTREQIADWVEGIEETTGSANEPAGARSTRNG